MMDRQQPVQVKSALSDFSFADHVLLEMTAANLLECVKEFWHTPFKFCPLVSPLWPLLHSGWAVPIITKSFSLLLCQYARYTFLCWAKALLKMKLVRHTSYTLGLLRMHTHNSSHDRFIFLLKLKWKAV